MRPQNLCWTSILQQHPPLFKAKISYLKLLVNFIVERASRDDCEIVGDYPLVRLHAQTLQLYIRDYQKYVAYLQRAGVINVTAGYQSGKQSKGYTLKEEYRTDLIPDWITDQKVLQKLQSVQSKRNREARGLYPNLCRWFGAGLEIDLLKATDRLNHLLNRKLQQCTTAAEAQWLKIGYAGQHLLMDQIASNRPSLSVDGSGNRFYSPLTGLKKDLRHFATYRGQSLVCVDVSCCQPFLLSRLLEPSFYTGFGAGEGLIRLSDLPPHVQDRVKPLIPAILQELRSIPSGNTPVSTGNENDNSKLMLLHPLSTPPPPYTTTICSRFLDEAALSPSGQEVARFRRQVSSGQFYERYQEAILELGAECPPDRDSLKESVCSALYSPNTGSSKAVEQKRGVFKATFPTIYGLMSVLKSGDHATLAILLQSMEAQIMLNRIGGRISWERPQMPLFSIHDSLCVPVGHEAYLQRVMVEELERAVGLTPSVKVEVWGGGTL